MVEMHKTNCTISQGGTGTWNIWLTWYQVSSIVSMLTNTTKIGTGMCFTYQMKSCLNDHNDVR